MKIEMGESLFYSWLRHFKQCQIVQTNWKVSPLWELKHDDELVSLMNLSDEFFSQKYGYRIFKKNVSLSQIIRQGECDVIGINIENGITMYYTVDVAFHESGLNYGSRQETVMKIAEKIIRTAMCLYGYFDTRCAEIVFASPKINPAVLYDANLCVADINQLFKDLDYDFTIRIIANNDFNDVVLQPILLLSNGVSDTSELFLRSYQLIKMFDDEKPIERLKAKENTTSASTSSDEVKVGTLARIVLRRLLESGAASQDEIKIFQTLDGSKKVFNLNFPLLVAVGGEFEHVRYYVDPLIIDGKKYRMTSQWFETQKKPLQQWIDEHSGKDE